MNKATMVTGLKTFCEGIRTAHNEIRAVGVRDWLWFVLYLNRNEFNRKLDLFVFQGTNTQLSAARKRAHYIDEKLDELRRKKS